MRAMAMIITFHIAIIVEPMRMRNRSVSRDGRAGNPTFAGCRLHAYLVIDHLNT